MVRDGNDFEHLQLPDDALVHFDKHRDVSTPLAIMKCRTTYTEIP